MINYTSEPIRGCFPANLTLHQKKIPKSPSCTRLQLNTSRVEFCACDSDLCNGHLYDYRDIRVKRHRFAEHFMFPFTSQLERAGHSLSAPKPVKRVSCYSCGSLFNRSAPACPHFEEENPSQRKMCDAGEVCLLYQWRKSKYETG